MSLNIIDKFVVVLGETFDNIGIIIGDLNSLGKTELNAVLVEVLKKYILSHDKKYLINTFTDNSYKYWTDIKNKNELSLTNNIDKIFGDYTSRPEFESIKLIFSSYIDEESKSYIWICLSSLVKLCIENVFLERGTTVSRVKNNEGKSVLKIQYKNKELYPEIKLIEHIKAWELSLLD